MKLIFHEQYYEQVNVSPPYLDLLEGLEIIVLQYNKIYLSSHHATTITKTVSEKLTTFTSLM